MSLQRSTDTNWLMQFDQWITTPIMQCPDHPERLLMVQFVGVNPGEPDRFLLSCPTDNARFEYEAVR